MNLILWEFSIAALYFSVIWWANCRCWSNHVPRYLMMSLHQIFKPFMFNLVVTHFWSICLEVNIMKSVLLSFIFKWLWSIHTLTLAALASNVETLSCSVCLDLAENVFFRCDHQWTHEVPPLSLYLWGWLCSSGMSLLLHGWCLSLNHWFHGWCICCVQDWTGTGTLWHAAYQFSILRVCCANLHLTIPWVEVWLKPG